jgi:PAS domain S-box-containing protein
MEKASEAIFVHNAEGRIIDANQRACSSTGYLKKELLTMAVGDIDSEAVQTGKGGLMWAKVIAGEAFIFEANQKRKDGSVFAVEVSLGPITFDNTTFVMGLVRDITERKKAEDELKQKYELLNGISEGIGTGLAIIGRDYQIVWANKTLSNIGPISEKKCYQLTTTQNMPNTLMTLTLRLAR